jgi:MSHA biogenesis protein MshJ
MNAKERLRAVIERIDAATLRERVFIFLALTLAVVFVVNVALLEPLRAKQKRLSAEVAQRQKELQAVQSQLPTMIQKTSTDPDAPNRAKLAALRERLAQLNQRIGQEQRRFTPPERMRGVLEEMLQRNKGLALVELHTTPAAPVAVSEGSGSTGLYRHGIEFTVTGSYADLYEYLRTLERLPTQLYWRKAELAVTAHPLITLKLTAYTVSFDPSWLVV